MSYDFSVRIDTGNKPVEVGDMNYTYNVSTMFGAAIEGGGIRSLADKRMSDIRDALQKGVADMRARPGFYKAMNPPNGWGDYDGALKVLETLLEWSVDYPNGFLQIH